MLESRKNKKGTASREADYEWPSKKGQGQRVRASGNITKAKKLSPLRTNRLQPGQPVVAAGAAQENRQLVTDEFAAEAGEAGRSAGKTCPLLLIDLSGESADEAAVWKHVAKDLGVTIASGIGAP